MATSTSAPILLLIAAAAVLILHAASSLACSDCPPTTPGCGGHCHPSHPAPGCGCGCGGGHSCPPHPDCPPCNNPPELPPMMPPAPRTCPIDALKLNACVDVLSGLLHLVIGEEAKAKCCPLVQGVADLDAALCLCTSLRLRLLNLNIYLPIALNLLITCGKHAPPGFQCPPLPLDD